jgi:uncharacterized cupin superfamily protein
MQINVNFEELPPAKRPCPSHYHSRKEGHLWILAEWAMLRPGQCAYPISPEVPSRQKAGHCLINEGDVVFPRPSQFDVIFSQALA